MGQLVFRCYTSHYTKSFDFLIKWNAWVGCMKRSTMPMKKKEACIEQVWNKAEEAEYPSITLDIWNMKSFLLKSGYGCKLDKIYPWGGGLTSLKSSTFNTCFFICLGVGLPEPLSGEFAGGGDKSCDQWFCQNAYSSNRQNLSLVSCLPKIH